MPKAKILNISTIIPLKDLERNNDIILRLQDYLQKVYKYEFIIAKPLPYINKWFANHKDKWRLYRQYQKRGIFSVQGFQIFVFPWLSLPTSNFLVNYLLLPLNWIWFKIRLQHQFDKVVKEQNLILAQTTIPDVIIAYWLKKRYSIPYIYAIRGNLNPIIPSLPLMKSVFKNAAAIITPSPTNYKNLKGIVNLQFLPHPIAKMFYSVENKDYSKIKIVSVCGLLRLKHIDWVINTLIILNNKGYDFEYHIVGDGPELECLKLLTQKNGLTKKIHFYGFIDANEVNKILQSSNIYIMPSFPETLGRAFLEAAAANCLCIGHKNTGVDGLFKHYESAIFVDKNSIVPEVEMLFKNFSESFLKRFTTNAKKIVDSLSWSNIGERYHKIYSDALKESLHD